MPVCGKCSPADLFPKNKICFYQNTFCDIILGMRKRFLFLLPVFAVLLGTSAHANWQYDGEYIGDGWFSDDGSRFVISARGGMSFGTAKIKNDVGELTPAYYMESGGAPFPEVVCVRAGGCSGYTFAGYANLGNLPVRDDKLDAFAFAAGASVGWTLPNRPQWRLELGWDHISKSEYNKSPFLEGETTLFDGAYTSPVIVSSGAVQSDITTDVISAMAFYDFFDGLQKPLQTVIPYVGFGIGYADVQTVLNLSDPYGDLSGVYVLQEFSKPDDNGVFQFYRAEKSNSTVAAILAAGVSYGLADSTFLDFGVRAMYIPKVEWQLTNSDDTKHRDWFSAKSLIYTNVMVGLRFEF